MQVVPRARIERNHDRLHAPDANLAYKGMTYDFLSTNTFTSVVGCKQSTPRNMDGSCPSQVSCP